MICLEYICKEINGTMWIIYHKKIVLKSNDKLKKYTKDNFNGINEWGKANWQTQIDLKESYKNFWS